MHVVLCKGKAISAQWLFWNCMARCMASWHTFWTSTNILQHVDLHVNYLQDPFKLATSALTFHALPTPHTLQHTFFCIKELIIFAAILVVTDGAEGSGFTKVCVHHKLAASRGGISCGSRAKHNKATQSHQQPLP
jgi:hypothetical protein